MLADREMNLALTPETCIPTASGHVVSQRRGESLKEANAPQDGLELRVIMIPAEVKHQDRLLGAYDDFLQIF